MAAYQSNVLEAKKVSSDREFKFGCLAQLVERRPYKANVGGSNPSAPTSASFT